jgi:SAM-dependent methyltransferase
MSVLSVMIRQVFSSLRRGARSAASGEPSRANYDPRVFDAADMESAKFVILNPLPDMTTAERWEVETRNLVALLGRIMPLDANSCVLDYGCGIGRLAKGLIERYGCQVVGVDISARMRELAREYVQTDRFIACSPDELDQRVAGGLRATHACACWVIQHCLEPDIDLDRIHSTLVHGASFFVLNSNLRWVPTDRGWAQDGISVEKLLAARFEVVAKSDNPAEVVSPLLAGQSYSMLLRKRD